MLLGFYGSCLRVETDLARAGIVLEASLEMARALDLEVVEADLLIRLSYVDLEQRSPARALAHAQAATLVFARLDDREGEGRGFLTSGTFQYYRRNYNEALRDFKAALNRSAMVRRRFAAHLNSAFCRLRLNQEVEARREAERARELAAQVAIWMQGKLSWFEARLSSGAVRIDHLKEAQAKLSSQRPADCLLVTVDLLKELLTFGHVAEADEQVLRLCDLVEQAGEARQVQRAVSYLVGQRNRLSPRITSRLQQALDRVHDRRLSRLVSTDS